MSSWMENPRLHLGLLLVLALLIFLGRQQDRGLPSLDDAYYARKSVEMMSAENPWVVTHGGEMRSDNPPFHFWVTALGYRLFGVSDFTSVLPSGLAATASVLLCYGLALSLFASPSLALLAASILLLPGFFQDYARRGMVDQTLTFLVLAACFALWQAGKRPRYYLLFGLATGAAILTKSVLGAFPLAIAVLYLLLIRPRRLVHPLFLAGFVLALAGPAYWIWQNVEVGGASFLRGHFGWLLWERAIHDPGQAGAGFLLGYLKLLLANYWPWLPFTLLGLAAAIHGYRRRRSPQAALLLVWPLLIIGVMSLTRNQFLRYVLGAFPALAILGALGLKGLLQACGGLRAVLATLLGIAVLNAIFINGTPLVIQSSTGLREHSVDERALVPRIREHCPEGRDILNYRLGGWSPRNALLFYSDRWLGDPVNELEDLERRLDADPDLNLICSVASFSQLKAQLPDRIRLVACQGDLVLATAAGRVAAAAGSSASEVPRDSGVPQDSEASGGGP